MQQQCTEAKATITDERSETHLQSMAAHECSTAAEGKGPGQGVSEGCGKGGSTKQQGGPSKEALAHLTAMGFTEVQAKNALHATSNSLERAANWLLFGLRS